MQSIVDGFQHEQPDYWLNFGNPWEIERLNVAYPIKFYGHVSVADENGRQVFRWNPSETVSKSFDLPLSQPHCLCISPALLMHMLRSEKAEALQPCPLPAGDSGGV